MNIDDYFLRSRDKIPPKEDRNLAKTSGSDTSASMLDSTPEEEEQQQVQISNEVVLDAAFCQTFVEITANITRVNDEKLVPLSQTISAHTQQLKKIEERTAEENRIASTEHACETIDSRVHELEKQVRSMAEHIDDLENRGRLKNVRITALPEDAEGSNPTKFFKGWIPKPLGMETKAGRVKIERASRTLAPEPGPNQRPRPVLIRFHNFTDKQKSLDAARCSGTTKYLESTIMFFQDLSAAVLRKRKCFDDVMKRLPDIVPNTRCSTWLHQK